MDIKVQGIIEKDIIYIQSMYKCVKKEISVMFLDKPGGKTVSLWQTYRQRIRFINL